MTHLFSPKKSFKVLLVSSFFILSLVPVVLVQIFSYYNINSIMQKNIDELEQNNLIQTQKNIQTNLEFYEDILFRIYTDDKIVKLIDQIIEGNDLEINNSQLRHLLHEYIYTLPYIQSISVLMKNGDMVFDDILTGYNTKTSWLETSDERTMDLFEQISSRDDLRIMSSQVVSYFSSKKYYLFHLAHRVIDYRNIYQKNAVIILSLDEKMLSDICNEQQERKSEVSDNFYIILGNDGTVISCPEKSIIGEKLNLPEDQTEKQQKINQLIFGNENNNAENLSIYEVQDPKTEWTFILIKDRKALYSEIANQQKITIVVFILSVIALSAIIFLISERLTQSIDTVIKAMNTAGEGNLSIRIRKDRKMPLEIDKIADNFNLMITQINELIEDVHNASIKQKDAEIKALEAQVNPHFLYNTLDTINWMAIEKDELEISNAINALAKILRYSIDNSNGIVEIRQEVEWLKQYILLQQTRLKNSFVCHIDVDPEAMDCNIHKLLFQPFVENAIIHGFTSSVKNKSLSIRIEKKESKIIIAIKDNGIGMNKELLESVLSGSRPETSQHQKIGIFNTVERFKMYYGKQAKITIESSEQIGTTVRIEYTEV